MAAINLVYSPGFKADRHKRLHNKFSDLVISIRTAEPSAENLKKWKKRRLTIEKDEPPIFWAVEADCYNEVCHAIGRKEYAQKIVWWKRYTMFYFRWSKLDSI